MATHEIATREQWLAARRQLLEAEKRLTRDSDAVARQRQALPWVRLDESYRFDTEAGSATLADLFQGRSQLLIYHFMFGPDYRAGCPSCSSIADGFNGIVTHLAHHDVMLWAVSRAPLEKLRAYQRRMGWTFPWASSADSDFNFDFHASFTPAQQQAGAEYNFRRDDPAMKMATAAAPPAEFVTWAGTTGTDLPTYMREREGLSAFVLEDGEVYHTYSTYSRGTDAIWAMYAWLDRAPRGRNESGLWLRRRDEYGDAAAAAGIRS